MPTLREIMDGTKFITVPDDGLKAADKRYLLMKIPRVDGHNLVRLSDGHFGFIAYDTQVIEVE